VTKYYDKIIECSSSAPFDGYARKQVDAIVIEADNEIALLERERNMYRKLFNDAIVCVDKVFQPSAQPATLLPDFLLAGEDKFQGVIKLATAYKEAIQILEAIENTCRGYARELAKNYRHHIGNYHAGE
jgi:hypothetical protein